MSDSTSDSESGTGSSTSSISEFRMPQEPFLASPSDRIDLVDSDDGGDRDEVILDLNATPPLTGSLPRAGGSVESDKHKEGGWIYISQRPERKIITGIPSSIHSWKNRFFYVVDQEASEPWSVPLVWDTPDTSKLSRKPLLEGEDSITFALMRKEIEQSGLIRCKEFSEEAILVGLGVSAATPEQMKKQSTVEKIRQGAQPRAQEGAQQAQQERQKRKATVLGSPAPSQGIPPPSQRPKTKVKLVGPFAQGGGSSKSGGASTGAGSGARPPAGISEQVFRPNWAVLKDDTALGESRVAAELMSKCLLQKDKQQVLYEPPATGEEAVLSSAYQILLYYNDLKEKSKSFSQAITSSEEHGSFSTCIISAASLSMLDLCRNSIRMLPRVVYPEAASFDSTSALAFSVRGILMTSKLANRLES
ncbi:uncharacterized protein LOC143858843 [Tasmannia lanceolata]|uniref:uncharacterized protein LOC143858843 n=1 Tax=Tasmannia lanceolata TaxID=3420 RepID=UPI0040648A81